MIDVEDFRILCRDLELDRWQPAHGGQRLEGRQVAAVGTVGEPIVCGGISVCPGDLAVADDDGGVVVPVIASIFDSSVFSTGPLLEGA